MFTSYIPYLTLIYTGGPVSAIVGHFFSKKKCTMLAIFIAMKVLEILSAEKLKNSARKHNLLRKVYTLNSR